jgi:pSer/pThr/pTyr-binding forkhead associated (FHA) protein
LHSRSPAELKALIEAQRTGSAFLEYRDGDDLLQIVALGPERDRLSIGRLAACEVAVTWDTEVSRAHALLEQVGGAWTVEDRGSSNGTLVNAVRINGPHVLRDADVVRVGRTQLIFHAAGDDDLRRTTPALDRVAPRPTDSQRKVLVELCRPRSSAAAARRRTGRSPRRCSSVWRRSRRTCARCSTRSRSGTCRSTTSARSWSAARSRLGSSRSTIWSLGNEPGARITLRVERSHPPARI